MPADSVYGNMSLNGQKKIYYLYIFFPELLTFYIIIYKDKKKNVALVTNVGQCLKTFICKLFLALLLSIYVGKREMLSLLLFTDLNKVQDFSPYIQ